jgi:hypothetical protein
MTPRGRFAAGAAATHQHGAPRWEQFLRTDVSKVVTKPWEEIVNGLIYLIGLIVVILFVLSFLGLR